MRRWSASRSLISASAALALALGQASCGNNGGMSSTPTTPATMLFAVGSLNDSAGALTGTIGVYLNAVAGLRTRNGTGFVNPGLGTITAPDTSVLNVCGITGYGQDPLAVLSATPNKGYPQSFAFGLPPAFPAPSSGEPGNSLGFLYFFGSDCGAFKPPPAPIPGQYFISTVVGTNGVPTQYAQFATMPISIPVLPNESLPGFTSTGGGGGTFSIAQPAGVTESVIIITQGTIQSGIRDMAALEATGTSATLPPGLLPPGNYVAYVIGADYPLVEGAHGSFTSAQGTVDLTVSAGTGLTL